MYIFWFSIFKKLQEDNNLSPLLRLMSPFSAAPSFGCGGIIECLMLTVNCKMEGVNGKSQMENYFSVYDSNSNSYKYCN